MKQFSNKAIVVPFDFSDEAGEAVNQALEWAEPTTNIHIVHVVEPTPAMISVDPAMPIPPSYEDERRDHAQKSLDKLFVNHQDQRIKVHCLAGDPGREIADFAESVRADMIIMPSHGRTGLTRWLLGSVAERVLRLAHCPVLVLRSAGKKAEQNADG